MTAALYILLAAALGYTLIKLLLPSLRERNWSVVLSASFLIGLLFMTWITYVVSYIFRHMDNPLIAGNIAAFSAGIIIVITPLLFKSSAFKLSAVYSPMHSLKPGGFAGNFLKNNKPMLIFIAFSTAFWTFFMVRSFSIDSNGVIKIGFSVFSDFAPHLAVIRSFSMGKNFPTVYPHFPDGSIRYHFLFFFLTGNLEYLGMRLDIALNLLSIISIVSFMVLLCEFSRMITGKYKTGYSAALFFTFRSSFAFLTFIIPAIKKGGFYGFLNDLLNNEVHIGKTLHEDWGLWTQKVYINQRHFAFALGIMMIMLFIFIPLLNKDNKPTKTPIGEYIFAGLILGLTAYFNGAVVIGTLCVLFVVAIFCRHRFKFLWTALIAVILSFLQTKFFTPGGGSVVSPEIKFGFLAENGNVISVLKYFAELLGLLPFIALAGFIASLIIRLTTRPSLQSPHSSQTSGIVTRGLILIPAFASPIILASFLKLTPDITVNHKYVMIAMILLGIPVGYIISLLFDSSKFYIKTTAVIITFLLTITGFIDLITQYNIDKNYYGYHQDNELSRWVVNNTEKDDIFLTAAYTFSPILLSGGRIYCGWPYYAWSAGYNTDERSKIVKKIYESTNEQDTLRLLKENHIDYVVVEAINGKSGDAYEYNLNLDFFDKNLNLVYSDNTYKVFSMKDKDNE